MAMKKKKNKNRATASLKESRVHSDKMEKYKTGSMGSTLLKSSSDNPGRADHELDRLMKGDVFRSNPQTVKETNSNKRRYA